MKNLKLLEHNWCSYKNIQTVNVITPLFDNSDEIIVCHDNLKISKINTNTHETTLLMNISEIVPIPDIYVINVVYFSIERILVCAINTGEVIKFDMNSNEILAVEDICCQKMKALEVSPDNELLIIVTDNYTVHLANYQLEIVNTASLLEDTFGDGEFITVGWGKKETQFHGSEGKDAAKKKVVIEDIDGESQNDMVIITWRGDGALFAVGFFLNSIFNFKVFDREAVLKYTSEKQPGLECNLTWKPSGNLIATTQHFPNKYVVAFFEKNGLKHGELMLPFKKLEKTVQSLCWSSDSEVLCVWCRDNSSLESSLLMYTVNNYHWYLKQSLNFSRDSDVSMIVWDEGNTVGSGKLLHLFLNGGIYSKYNWVWSVDASKGKTDKDNALVGVVDGNKLLLTSFRKAVIPPPMASFIFQCDKNINQVVFGPPLPDDDCNPENINSNSFILFKEDESMELFKTDAVTGEINSYGTVSVSDKLNSKLDLQIPHFLSQIFWLSKTILLGISTKDKKSLLHIIELSNTDNLSVKNVETIPIHEHIIGITGIPFTNYVFMQTTSGKFLQFLLNSEIKEFETSFAEPCYQFEVSNFSKKDSNIFTFGLSYRNRFYINNQEVANNVNSFFVHSDFLLLTTLQHQLLCCPLSKDIINIFNVGKNKESRNVNSAISNRKLERGSRIVIAVSCDTRTILQLPRGNIEAIQPRALSLKTIGDLLDSLKYYKAFDFMRKQRINLNLIHDHDSAKFLNHIDIFISEINNPSWLSLFISDLENQDVTQTMYVSSYCHKSNDNNKSMEKKIITVCDIIREALKKNNLNNKNLLPILTTYVKKNTIIDMEKALLLIKEVKLENNTESLVSADEALKYLLYLVNVNYLYDVALGLYDFELVMFVASKSQKDPKEYIPYLNKLKEMEENYKKFSIDNNLKRYQSALKNLIACGSEKEVELFSYIKQHALYKDALQFIEKDDSRYQRCAEEYGNYLMMRKNYTEAGIMYMRSNNLPKALNSFIEASDWHAAMNVVEDLNMSDQDKLNIVRKLLHKLKDAKKYSEALNLMQYNNFIEIEELVSCALEGRFYKRALNICKKCKKCDLIESHIKSAVMEQYTSLMTLITQNKEQFSKQKARLLLVKQNKSDTHELTEDLPEDCDLYSDTSSIVSSGATRSSGRSFRSSKNRRKHERKLVSLKEGSRFEDIALIRSLHVIVTSTFELRHDVGEMNFALQWLEKDNEATDLQNSLDAVLKEMKSSFAEIWTPELWNDSNKAGINEKYSAQSRLEDLPDPSSSLEPYIKIAPVIQDVKWKMEPL